jgi:DNA polymerase III epsilon subunit-like protein
VDFLLDPGIPLPPETTRITGITPEQLKGQPSFGQKYESLVDFYIGEKIMVGHNLDFDSKLLQFDLMRIGREFHFPWPWRRICTVEASFSIKKFRLNLGQLFELATGKTIKGAHRAINDVLALAECLRWLKKKGLVNI